MKRLAISLDLINAVLASGMAVSVFAADFTLRGLLHYFTH